MVREECQTKFDRSFMMVRVVIIILKVNNAIAAWHCQYAGPCREAFSFPDFFGRPP
jgi:hypothetical protein